MIRSGDRRNENHRGRSPRWFCVGGNFEHSYAYKRLYTFVYRHIIVNMIIKRGIQPQVTEALKKLAQLRDAATRKWRGSPDAVAEIRDQRGIL